VAFVLLLGIVLTNLSRLSSAELEVLNSQEIRYLMPRQNYLAVPAVMDTKLAFQHLREETSAGPGEPVADLLDAADVAVTQVHGEC
jgi:hypothetical protein